MATLPLGPEDPAGVSGYRFLGRIGSGGMGSVYLSCRPDGQPIAVKVIRRELADFAEFRQRFREEVAAAQRVQGRHVARVVAADPDGHPAWLATEYVAGPSLATAVADHGPFPAPATLALLTGVAQGIAAVHAAGLIHRDLKPANVLLAADGPRVIDFGIAHAGDAASQTSTGQAVGTPAFLAPEQVHGEVSQATDVWALGHLTLVAATGHTAFGDGNRDALIYRILNVAPNLDGCHPSVRPLLERCLAKDPASRPAIPQLLAQAQDAMQGQATTFAGGSWLPRAVANALPGYAPPPPGAAVPPPAAGPATGARLPDSPGTTLVLPVGEGFAPPSGPYPGPAGTPSAFPPPVPGRRKSRGPIAIIAALAAVAIALIAYELTASGSGGTPPAGRTAGASGQASAGTPQPSPSASYPVTYANAAFRLAGGSCHHGNQPQAAVSFTAGGPQVMTGSADGTGQGDLNLECGSGDNGSPAASIDFGDQAFAQVSGSQTASSCMQAITTRPGTGSIAFGDLTSGEQFCVKAASGLLVDLTLTRLNDKTFTTNWTATAWSVPS